MHFMVKKHSNVYTKVIRGKDIYRDLYEYSFILDDLNVDYFLGSSPCDVDLTLAIDCELCTFYKEVECEF